MLEYLRMLKEKKVLVGPLLDSTYPLEQATNAFDSLKSEKGNPLLVLLSYPGLLDRIPLRKVSNPKSEALTSNKIRIALIGAGSFAQSTHLARAGNSGTILHRSFHHRAWVPGSPFQTAGIRTDYRRILQQLILY